MYIPVDNEIFHVHTYRCGHAAMDSDEDYVLKAIEHRAERIVFTDHAPFPKDPFGSRMRMSEYAEYLDSIHSLRDKYRDSIQVLCGVEVEFFPQYLDYYRELRETLDVMVLGQHMYMHEDGTYNFMDKDRSKEYKGISDAMIAGMKTGLFDVLAHPDRMHMRHPEIDEDIRSAIRNVANTALEYDVLLEKNYGSMYKEHNYSQGFWEIAGDVKYIHGYDAHGIADFDMIVGQLG